MEPLGIDIPTDGDLLVLGRGQDGGLSTMGDAFGPLLRDASASLWDGMRGPLAEALRRELGIGDRFADGFTLYDIDVRLSRDPRITVQRTDGGDLLVHVVTGRSTIVATTTQPSFLGSYADPRFSVDFSVSFDYLLDVPPAASPLAGSQVTGLRFTEGHLDSQNFAGDLLLAVANIVTWLAGTSVDALIAGALQAGLGPTQVNAALGPVNDRIQAYVDQGYHYLSLHVGDPQDLLRQLGGAPAGLLDALPGNTQSLLLVCRQPDTSGAIEGEISWPDGDGRPLDAAAYALASSLAVGRLDDLALEGLPAGVQREAGERVVGDGPAMEQQRVAVAVNRFAKSPAAARAEQDSLATSPGARIWDASVQAEPPEVSQLGFAGAVVSPALGLRSLLSSSYESIMDAFRRGPLQFSVRCVVTEEGWGTHETGHMVAMWHEASDGWQRRRYRVEGVETDRPLEVSARLADGYRWHPGAVESIDARNWTGRVTVHPPLRLADQVRDGILQVTVSGRDGSRRTVPIGMLEAAGALRAPAGERSIIIVGGSPLDEVSLNPQPLPPRWREHLRQEGDDRAIIIVGGRDGGDVALNPQPLPPRVLGHPRGPGGVDQVAQRRDDVDLRVMQEAAVGAGRLDVDAQVAAARILRSRGQGVFLRRHGGGALGIEDQARRGIGEDLRVERDVEDAIPDAAVARVDAFGDLVTEIDPDIFIPDVDNPTGHGTLGGVDFRVWSR